MDDSDKQILDEVAEAATYLYLKLLSQEHDEPGRVRDKVFSGAQAAEMTAAAMPGILQARLGVLRVAS